MAVKIKFIYLDKLDSQKRLQMAYSRIFTIAQRNFIERRKSSFEKVVQHGRKK